MSDYSTECKSIILEYLLHYCYKNTTKSFLNELDKLNNCAKSIQMTNTNDKVNVDWIEINARKDIYDAIKHGNIKKAFDLMESTFPDLIRTYNTINRMNSTLKELPKSHYIIYKLRCQQFIEIRRDLGDLEAISFAKTHLTPCKQMYPELINSVTTLVAYNDLEHEQIKHLLSQSRRDTIADEVNDMILESLQQAPKTALEKIWRQKTSVQVELDNQKQSESLKNQKTTDNTDKMPM